MRKYLLPILVLITLSILSFVVTNNVSATCTDFEGGCQGCDCADIGCNGTERCQGMNGRRTCYVTRTCNPPDNNNSCNCGTDDNGYSYDDTDYHFVNCAPGARCIGSYGDGCNYCATPVCNYDANPIYITCWTDIDETITGIKECNTINGGQWDAICSGCSTCSVRYSRSSCNAGTSTWSCAINNDTTNPGFYTDLPSCQGPCIPPTKYKCNGSSCEINSTGSFTTSNCDGACESPNCDACNTWTDSGNCGDAPCAASEKPQTRTCTAAGTSDCSTARCAYNPACGSPPNSERPTGVIDYVTCNEIAGWTCDADKYDWPLNVRLYKDTISSATYLGYGTANQLPETFPGLSPQGCNNTGYHRYFINTPNSVKDGTSHKILVSSLGIDSSGLEDGSNTELSDWNPGHTQTITCSPPPSPSPTVRPWIQVTGDVHSNTGIKMTGGPP